MKNWMTTVAGIVGALATLSVKITEAGTPWDWKAYVMAAVPLVIGLLAKDLNTTGNGACATKEKQAC